MTLAQKKPLLAVAGLIALAVAIVWWRDDSSARQGWTPTDRKAWYSNSQGSRLIPYKWFMALEQPDGGKGMIADEAYLASFGHLPSPDDRKPHLPVGFALDQQPDDDFVLTKRRWYVGQDKLKPEDAEPWLGFNCAACHTGEVTYKGRRQRIDGGPTMANFQSFVEAINNSMLETIAIKPKFEKFAAAVLATNDQPNRDLLLRELRILSDWQEKATELARSPRYGPGRLDAFGHILNKVEMFAGGSPLKGNPADAPVSYPFLWGINKHEYVQWNGLAPNIPLPMPQGRVFDIGAMGRNAAEVLGVFAEVVVKPPQKTGHPDLIGNAPLGGFVSSINIDNLQWFENTVAKLEVPKWPAMLPPIDPIKAGRGLALYNTHCVHCHRTPQTQPAGKPPELMVPISLFSESSKPDKETIRTDIWMACNVINDTGASGTLKGTKAKYISLVADPKPLDTITLSANILAITARGALLGKGEQIAMTAANEFFGIPRWKIPEERIQSMLNEKDLYKLRRETCFDVNVEPEQVRIRAYKARPLDGIWATAPYLHNGSVPTLYHLLLPSKDRPPRFWVGSQEIDPKHVGFEWLNKPATNAFELITRDQDGNQIEGNANVGHEYGVNSFENPDQRWDLIEYLKTL